MPATTLFDCRAGSASITRSARRIASPAGPRDVASACTRQASIQGCTDSPASSCANRRSQRAVADARGREVVRRHGQQLGLERRPELVVALPEARGARGRGHRPKRGSRRRPRARGRARARSAPCARTSTSRPSPRGGAARTVALAVGRLRYARARAGPPRGPPRRAAPRARGEGSGRPPRLLRSPPHGGRPTAAPPPAPGRRTGGRRSRCRATCSLSAPRAVSSRAAPACSAWHCSGGICS